MRHYDAAAVAKFVMDRTVQVTICVPVFNGGAFLQACLDSLVTQEFENFVVIVIDNCSTDDTPTVCMAFEDERFFYRRNDRNLGSIGNHNVGLECVQTPFAKLFSADDVLFRATLAKQMQVMLDHASVGLVTCNLVETNANLCPRREVEYFRGRTSGKEVVKTCVAKVQNLIGGPSNTLLRMSAVGQTRFDPTLRWLADLEFHCRVLERVGFANIDEPGFLYRRHQSTDSELGCPPDVRRHDERVFVNAFRGGPLSHARITVRHLRRLWRRTHAPGSDGTT